MVDIVSIPQNINSISNSYSSSKLDDINRNNFEYYNRSSESGNSQNTNSKSSDDERGIKLKENVRQVIGITLCCSQIFKIRNLKIIPEIILVLLDNLCIPIATMIFEILGYHNFLNNKVSTIILSTFITFVLLIIRNYIIIKKDNEIQSSNSCLLFLKTILICFLKKYRKSMIEKKFNIRLFHYLLLYIPGFLFMLSMSFIQLLGIISYSLLHQNKIFKFQVFLDSPSTTFGMGILTLIMLLILGFIIYSFCFIFKILFCRKYTVIN